MSPSVTNNVELFATIQATCKDLFGVPFHDTRHIVAVDVGWRPDKLERRILVISKFRVFLVSGKTVAKLTVERDFHLLSILGIETSINGDIKLSLESKTLHIKLSDPYPGGSEGLVAAVLSAYKHYFPRIDSRYFLNVTPTNLHDLFAKLPESMPPLPCDNFRRTYAALCDFYKLQYRDEVAWDVEKIYASHDCRILRLDDFDHLSARDLIPLLSVLQYSGWFDGLCIENNCSGFKLTGEMVDTICTAVRKSRCLKTLTLVSCGLKSDFLLNIAQSISDNHKALPLQRILLPGNQFDDIKIVNNFVQAICVLSSGLTELDLSNCSISPKSLNSLAAGLAKHQPTLDSLKTLNLSQNVLKDHCNDLMSLLSKTVHLEYLNLSQTGFAVEYLFKALTYSGHNLRELRLRGCVFSYSKHRLKHISTECVAEIEHAKSFISTVARSLTLLDISDCSFPSDVLKCILLGLTMNYICKQQQNYTLGNDWSDGHPHAVDNKDTCSTQLLVELNLSQPVGAMVTHLPQLVEPCSASLSVIGSLILQDASFAGDDLAIMLQSIEKMPNLQRLDLSGTRLDVGGGGKQHQDRNHRHSIIRALNNLLKDGIKLSDLSLANMKIGSDLSVVLSSLGVCDHLTRLDISGNLIRDFGARLLAKALQINCSLQRLTIDRNQITPVGYADIEYALRENHTLVEMAFPITDICECKERERAERIMNVIQNLTSRNRRENGRKRDDKTSKVHFEGIAEELRVQAYKAHSVLKHESLADTNSGEVNQLRSYLRDSEKIKDVIDGLNNILCRDSFIEENVKRFANDTSDEMRAGFRTNCDAMCDYMTQEYNVWTGSDKFGESVKLNCDSKITNFALSQQFSDFEITLKNQFVKQNQVLVSQVAEDTATELVKRMDEMTRFLNQKAKTGSKQSLNSMDSNQSNSQKSSTPKMHRNILFGKKSRPKSHVGGSTQDLSDTITTSSDDPADPIVVGSGINTPASTSSSFDALSPEASPDQTPKPLVHLAKQRPRRVKNHPISKVQVVDEIPEPQSSDRCSSPIMESSEEVLVESGRTSSRQSMVEDEEQVVRLIDAALEDESYVSTPEKGTTEDVEKNPPDAPVQTPGLSEETRQMMPKVNLSDLKRPLKSRVGLSRSREELNAPESDSPQLNGLLPTAEEGSQSARVSKDRKSVDKPEVDAKRPLSLESNRSAQHDAQANFIAPPPPEGPPPALESPVVDTSKPLLAIPPRPPKPTTTAVKSPNPPPHGNKPARPPSAVNSQSVPPSLPPKGESLESRAVPLRPPRPPLHTKPAVPAPPDAAAVEMRLRPSNSAGNTAVDGVTPIQTSNGSNRLSVLEMSRNMEKQNLPPRPLPRSRAKALAADHSPSETDKTKF